MSLPVLEINQMLYSYGLGHHQIGMHLSLISACLENLNTSDPLWVGQSSGDHSESLSPSESGHTNSSLSSSLSVSMTSFMSSSESRE